MLSSKQAQFKTAHSPRPQTKFLLQAFLVLLIFTLEGHLRRAQASQCAVHSLPGLSVSQSEAGHMLTAFSLACGRIIKPMQGGKKALNRCALLSGLFGEGDGKECQRDTLS